MTHSSQPPIESPYTESPWHYNGHWLADGQMAMGSAANKVNARNHTNHRGVAEVEQAPSHAWMITLADLLSLVLTFFVMLYSMSAIPSGAWQDSVAPIRESLNPEQIKPDPIASEQTAIVRPKRILGQNLDYLQKILEDKFERLPELPASLIRREDALVVSLASDLLFENGSATIHHEQLSSLIELVASFRHIQNHISVEGHTDPNPITDGEFASNWQLSLARAISVANTIRLSGYETQLRTIGRADRHFNYISQDLPYEERYNQSRRVDIVIRSTHK